MTSEESTRKANQSVWERFRHSWHLTYTTHRQADYSVGRDRDENGDCQCPVCQVVRQIDKKEAPGDE